VVCGYNIKERKKLKEFMNNTKKLELTITALKQSLAAKVADYEEQLASIRAEASLLLEEQAEKITELQTQIESAKGVPAEDVAVSSQDA